MRLRKDLFQYNSHNVMLLPCIIVAYRFNRIKPFLSVLQAPLEFIQIAVFETQKDLISLQPGSVYRNLWSIQVHGL